MQGGVIEWYILNRVTEACYVECTLQLSLAEPDYPILFVNLSTIYVLALKPPLSIMAPSPLSHGTRKSLITIMPL